MTFSNIIISWSKISKELPITWWNLINVDSYNFREKVIIVTIYYGEVLANIRENKFIQNSMKLGKINSRNYTFLFFPTFLMEQIPKNKRFFYNHIYFSGKLVKINSRQRFWAIHEFAKFGKINSREINFLKLFLFSRAFILKRPCYFE